VVKTDYEYLQRLMKVSDPLPTVGLTSPTSLTKNASISKAINGVRNDIIVGRKPLSSWDAAVKTYNSSGGAQIAKEYSEAYAAANS
jgi:putative aldouronate transport system substrate-binding protein